MTITDFYKEIEILTKGIIESVDKNKTKLSICQQSKYRNMYVLFKQNTSNGTI